MSNKLAYGFRWNSLPARNLSRSSAMVHVKPLWSGFSYVYPTTLPADRWDKKNWQYVDPGVQLAYEDIHTIYRVHMSSINIDRNTSAEKGMDSLHLPSGIHIKRIYIHGKIPSCFMGSHQLFRLGQFLDFSIGTKHGKLFAGTQKVIRSGQFSHNPKFQSCVNPIKNLIQIRIVIHHACFAVLQAPILRSV